MAFEKHVSPIHIPFRTRTRSRRRPTCLSASKVTHSHPEEDPLQTNQPFLHVVLPTALALLLCNMDRICLSIAIIPMSAEFGWAGGLQVSRARKDVLCTPLCPYYFVLKDMHKPCVQNCGTLDKLAFAALARRVSFSPPSYGATWPRSCWGDI
jgi:hypothetical protein